MCLRWLMKLHCTTNCLDLPGPYPFLLPARATPRRRDSSIPSTAATAPIARRPPPSSSNKLTPRPAPVLASAPWEADVATPGEPEEGEVEWEEEVELDGAVVVEPVAESVAGDVGPRLSVTVLVGQPLLVTQAGPSQMAVLEMEPVAAGFTFTWNLTMSPMVKGAIPAMLKTTDPLVNEALQP